MRNDRVYLRYIVEALDAVGAYLAGSGGAPDEQLFFTDAMRRDAVLRRLETLADATGHLSDALKERHPELAWRRIVDFRNVLAHAYARVDHELVWRVIVTDLPLLRTLVDSELVPPT